MHKEREHEVDYQRNTMDVLSGGGFLSRTPPPLSSSSTSSSPTKDYTPSQTTYSSNRIIPSTTSTHQHPHTITDDPFSYKGRIAIALYSFTAEFEEEMTINERDTLVIDESAPERPGWIYATNPYNNQEGYIPENYIEH